MGSFLSSVEGQTGCLISLSFLFLVIVVFWKTFTYAKIQQANLEVNFPFKFQQKDLKTPKHCAHSALLQPVQLHQHSLQGWSTFPYSHWLKPFTCSSIISHTPSSTGKKQARKTKKNLPRKFLIIQISFNIQFMN